MYHFLKKQSPARIIAIGFLLLILLGSGLLMLPFCIRPGVELSYIDALYTSTSAVCVTGLIAVDVADTFTGIGQAILGLLIQAGGLGVTAVGAGIILALGKRMNQKSRVLVQEAMNLDSAKGIALFVQNIFRVTVAVELAGALLCYPVFRQDHEPLHAVGISLFHAVAAFNNAGFDILGNFQSLSPYRGNALLMTVTALMIILGGIGFLVLRELGEKKLRWKSYSMHTRVVLSVSAVLIVAGTLLLKLTEELSWLDAFFYSVSARTAGFAVSSMGQFSAAGLLTVCVLMFIGASSGSTGGGIKTSTFFVLLQGIKSSATNTGEKAFHYSVPRDAFRKAAVITLLSLTVVLTGTWLLLILQPELLLTDALFEIVSAFATVGLSTGITPGLDPAAKLLSILIMYIGRLGPWTVVTLWYFSLGERVRYPEGNISIG